VWQLTVNKLHLSCWLKSVLLCDRSDPDVADDSEYSAVPLTQLLAEMNAESSDLHPCTPPHPSCQFQCRCITDKHQAARICTEHFLISSDDERTLSNIAGTLSVFGF